MQSGRDSITGGEKQEEPKWKMMIVTGMAIYPLILLLPTVLDPFIRPLPQWLGQLAVMTVMMPLATYVAVPAITFMFERWLHKP